MSYKTLTQGLKEIKASISTMTDAQLRDKLYDMGFKVVPSHFITELRNQF